MESSTRYAVHLMLRNAIETLNVAMSGFKLGSSAIDTALKNLDEAVRQSSLPIFEIGEQLSVLSGQIPSPLYNGISAILDSFLVTIESGGRQTRYV